MTKLVSIPPPFSSTALGSTITAAFITPPPTRSNRHTRRCAFYYRRYFRLFESLSFPLRDALSCKMNPAQAPLFTEEKVETFKEINQKLADMYNKRFDSYRKLVAGEKGLEYAPYTKTNKYVLKCVEL